LNLLMLTRHMRGWISPFRQGRLKPGISPHLSFVFLLVAGIASADSPPPAAADLDFLKLPGGMFGVVENRPGMPVVSVAVYFPVGRSNEPSAGLARILAKCCVRGTVKRDATALYEDTAKLGAEFYADTGYRMSFIGMEGPAVNMAAMVGLVLELAFRPALTDESAQTERTFALGAVERQEDFTSLLFQRKVLQRMWPLHPISLPSYGSGASVKAVRAEDIRNLHRDVFLPSRCSVIVTGRASPDDVRVAVESAYIKLNLADLSAAGRELQPASLPEMPVGRRVRFKKQGSQAEVFAGCAVPAMKPAEEAAVDLLNEILTGFNGRLFISLRRRYGYVYYAMPVKIFTGDFGLWGIQTGTKPANAEEVERIIFRELETVSREGVTDEEMRTAKATLETRQRRAASEAGGSAAILAEYVARDWPVMSVRERTLVINSVTAEDVRAMAERLYNKGQLNVVISK